LPSNFRNESNGDCHETRILAARGRADSRGRKRVSRGCGRAATLLNVSYDPTRELWRDINERFIADYKAKTGAELTINQSHGGSGTQARAVIDGLEADVGSLASYIDTNAIAKGGLIKSPWSIVCRTARCRTPRWPASTGGFCPGSLSRLDVQSSI
jgi:ABC-type sulfate transport system substrate-binding protein